MKKLLLVFLMALIFMSGCGSKNDETGETVVEIKEKLFIEQTNEMYYNPEEYLGKTIKLEGIFDAEYDVENEEYRYYVIRYGPGCCGDDSYAGFEVVWDKDEFPEADEWVEAVGVLETYEVGEYESIRLRLKTLEVLDERGEEYVAS